MSFTWNGDNLHSRIRSAMLRGLFIGANIVHEKAVTSILNGQKSGEVYTTKFFTMGFGDGRIIVPYGKRPPHRASAPGEAPASDSGRLVASGQVTLDVAKMSANVNFATEYAAILEFGTEDARNEPRPFLRPALNSSYEEILGAIVTEVAAEIAS